MTVCDKSCTCKVPEDKPCGEEDRGVAGGDGAGDGDGDGDGADALNGTGGLRLNDGAGGGTGATGAGAAGAAG